jgi:hypothetical protein
LLTETVIVTPEEVDSKIRLGVETTPYISTALAWLVKLESVMQTMSIKNGASFSRRVRN